MPETRHTSSFKAQMGPYTPLMQCGKNKNPTMSLLLPMAVCACSFPACRLLIQHSFHSELACLPSLSLSHTLSLFHTFFDSSFFVSMIKRHSSFVSYMLPHGLSFFPYSLSLFAPGPYCMILLITFLNNYSIFKGWVWIRDATYVTISVSKFKWISKSIHALLGIKVNQMCIFNECIFSTGVLGLF